MLRKNKRPVRELSKVCRKCRVRHPFSEFKTNAQPVSSRDRWPFGYCRDCRLGISDVKKENLKRKVRAATTKDLLAKNQTVVKTHFEATTARNFQVLVELRKKTVTCYICKRPPSRGKFVIDHNHRTGVCRGILCNECNTGLGFFFDDPKVLAAAIRYLEFPPLEEMKIQYPFKGSPRNRMRTIKKCITDRPQPISTNAKIDAETEDHLG